MTKSDLSVEGVDWRWVLIYLGLTMTPHDKVVHKLTGVLPRRTYKAGKKPSRRPTILTASLDQHEERWWYPVAPGKLTIQQKKHLLGCVTEQLTRLVFRTHFYEWEGTLYRQVKGGPIGLRASGPIGRILMDFWAQEIKKLSTHCQELHEVNPVSFEPVKIHLLHKYVDDCLAVLDEVRLGVRWCKVRKTMLWSRSCEEEDKEAKVNSKVNTMKQFSLMASDILSCLRFTYDCPVLATGDGMPVLDTEMWIQTEQRDQGIPEQIMPKAEQKVKLGTLKKVVVYKFFKKPMADTT